jgi:beta-lactamase superfamily II metal-dependent hydrolase
MARVFAGYPAPFIREAPEAGSTKVQQLIWGDFVSLLGGASGEWVEVRSRGEEGWMPRSEIQEEQLLEIGFVDIGQGDGAFVVTPDDRFLLVDAGAGDNMVRFLSWRFNLRRNPARVISFEKTVISHADQDHYKGFADLFASPQFRFDAVYHNGIVERDGDDPLGPRERHDGWDYLTDVVGDDASLRELLADPANVGSRQYPRMLKAAVDGGRVTEIRALSATDGFVPGYEAGEALAIEVHGPVRETVGGKPALRWFGDPGKTKNGHSVVLRLVYRNVRILLGGDLNVPAEEHLLGHHTGLDPRPSDEPAREALVAAARPVFEADVAKACHHGSADFTDLFLRAVNPLAVVVSSGDDEPYAHPRPDTLGALGKHGRGPRLLLFSTELARSTKESIKAPLALRGAINRLAQELAAAATADERARAQAALDAALTGLKRSVAVYGLINLRTDGRRVVLAQKLERPRGRSREEWDVHCLEPDAAGTLRYLPEW